MLDDFLLPELVQQCILRRQLWFQQDGAIVHTARASMETLREMFHNSDVTWPSRSPDLSPCNFFLWGYLKQKVYENRPHTTEELKESIRAEIQNNPLEMLCKTMDSVSQRAEVCLRHNGAHLSDNIFK